MMLVPGNKKSNFKNNKRQSNDTLFSYGLQWFDIVTGKEIINPAAQQLITMVVNVTMGPVKEVIPANNININFTPTNGSSPGTLNAIPPSTGATCASINYDSTQYLAPTVQPGSNQGSVYFPSVGRTGFDSMTSESQAMIVITPQVTVDFTPGTDQIQVVECYNDGYNNEANGSYSFNVQKNPVKTEVRGLYFTEGDGSVVTGVKNSGDSVYLNWYGSIPITNTIPTTPAPMATNLVTLTISSLQGDPIDITSTMLSLPQNLVYTYPTSFSIAEPTTFTILITTPIPNAVSGGKAPGKALYSQVQATIGVIPSDSVDAKTTLTKLQYVSKKI